MVYRKSALFSHQYAFIIIIIKFYSTETESNYVEDVESNVIRNNPYNFSRSNFPSGHVKKLIFFICLKSECVRKKTIYES